MSQAWSEKRLYSRLHQLSSQSYNRAQREKSAWCKQCMSLELEARPYPLWQKQDFTRPGVFFHVNGVRELWADTAIVPVTEFRHMSRPTVLDRAMIYSQWKMASEYFIESLLLVIGHSSDRLPDPTFNISHIFVEAQTCKARVVITDQCLQEPFLSL